MLQLSQRDPRWKDHSIGDSPLTLGAYGCTTTALSMLTSYFGCYKDPVEIQKYQGYTIDGLIVWESLHLGKLHFVKRLYKQNDAEIQASLADPNKACIIEVALKTGHHWMTVVGKVPLINAYFVIDPWDAQRKTTMAYGNKISGSAHYSI